GWSFTRVGPGRFLPLVLWGLFVTSPLPQFVTSAFLFPNCPACGLVGKVFPDFWLMLCQRHAQTILKSGHACLACGSGWPGDQILRGGRTNVHKKKEEIKNDNHRGQATVQVVQT